MHDYDTSCCFIDPHDFSTHYPFNTILCIMEAIHCFGFPLFLVLSTGHPCNCTHGTICVGSPGVIGNANVHTYSVESWSSLNYLIACPFRYDMFWCSLQHQHFISRFLFCMFCLVINTVMFNI
jgi:hypothetical protein